MYESIALNCCNYSAGGCVGGLFKFDRLTGKIDSWIDSELAGKPCRVTKGLPCAFFNSTVIPSIPDSQNSTLAAYQIAVDKNRRQETEPTESMPTLFELKCRKCKAIFHSKTRNKVYCQSCYKNRRNGQIRANVQKYRKKR